MSVTTFAFAYVIVRPLTSAPSRRQTLPRGHILYESAGSRLHRRQYRVYTADPRDATARRYTGVFDRPRRNRNVQRAPAGTAPEAGRPNQRANHIAGLQ